MNKEDIIRKAKQEDEIEIVDFIKLAILQEREACAKVADKEAADWYDNTGVGDAIAAAIRARGQA